MNIIKLYITQFYPALRYLFRSRAKDPSQLSLFKHVLSVGTILLLARGTNCYAHSRKGKIIVLFILILMFAIHEERLKILDQI
jgi:hypothetical protein